LGLGDTLSKEGFITTTFESVVKSAQKYSMWPMPLGISCCGIEMMGVAAPRFDIARFGSEVFRMTPRQSDFLLVAGTVTYKMAWVVRKIYDQMPDPKWVMSMGVCASTGGMFRSYPVVQGVDKFLPVDVYIAGCPPRPEAILKGLMFLQEKVSKYKPTLANFGKDLSPTPKQEYFESDLTRIEI
jgi:NADH-quinone oxidoreductase subunit B